MLEMLFFCRIWVLKRVARSHFLRLFNDGSDNTALLSRFPLKIRSVRILDTIVCSGSFGWLFSPAWDTIKLTLPGCWLHLSFRGHWPYLFRRDDGSCSELAQGLMLGNFLPIPDGESLPFYPSVLKLVVNEMTCTNMLGWWEILEIAPNFRRLCLKMYRHSCMNCIPLIVWDIFALIIFVTRRCYRVHSCTFCCYLSDVISNALLGCTIASTKPWTIVDLHLSIHNTSNVSFWQKETRK